MKKLWQDEAWEDYVYWQTQDKKTLKRINKLLHEKDRDRRNSPYTLGKIQFKQAVRVNK